MSVRSLAVIPVRLAASRLPGKPLMMLGDRSVVQWVWDATVASSVFTDVVVATPDDEVAEVVEGFGGHIVMTSDEHRSGTERVAEVAARHDHPIVANVQGDQPFVTTEMLRALVDAFSAHPSPTVSTIATPLTSIDQIDDPNTVKVILDRLGDAIYFSRAPIPHDVRRGLDLALHHIGLYAYQRVVLEHLATLPPSPLELAEGLEQLRALENGYRIRVGVVSTSTIEINTPEDMTRARALIAMGTTT
ncbi:MAG: 3-deoxy-manno-octulosonate cytidylyltransferase [Actinomycetota bacterium]